MEKNQEILSDIIVHMKYAKYLPHLERRETWDEICDRYEEMLFEKYPRFTSEIIQKMEFVRHKKVLPSMRAMQFAGPAIKRNHSRIYNCAYLPINDIRAFSEAMFLLLGGTGVGYSVQKHHVAQLPPIQRPDKRRRFLVGDSLEGWADSIKVLLKSYFGYHRSKPDFDFSDIRPKGTRLITAGGKAPGPEPLILCIAHLTAILDRKQDGEKLTPLECHDMMCHIANAVLAGGIRRSAMISLFSHDDEEMLNSKFGTWWELNEQRGRANNSAVLYRDQITGQEFFSLWKKIELSGCGEPGFYFNNHPEWGTNPCCEIALKPFQFCNLCEINASDIKDQNDFNERASTAAFFGTLQAGFTDFHYLKEEWKQNTEQDALIGVGITGIASGRLNDLNLREASNIVKTVNEITAKKIGIHTASRTTTIKPSGTTSLVLGTSSGIHPWYGNFYLRRIRIGREEALCKYLEEYHPELIEEDLLNTKQKIIRIPQNAPKGATTRHEGIMFLLERISRFNEEWVRNGYRSGENDNNVSATISIKEDEWEMAGQWMWSNKASYNGLSVLPYDNGNYKQAPFTDIDEEEFLRLESQLKRVNLKNVIEHEDDTDLKAEAACGNGGCMII